jgi:uncharacterized protein (TIGR02757 family)
MSSGIRLKKILDTFYREYDFAGSVLRDPIEFPHRYRNPADIEMTGFLASSFAYGRVDLFRPVVENILSIMGASPYGFLLDLDLKKHRKLFYGIKYRFNETDDIICLLFILHKILKKYSSIENAFREFYAADDITIANGLSGLMTLFLHTDTSPVYGKNMKPAGLSQFFPSPDNGSACKRANLFLRWMIRDKDIDFGIWKDIPKNKLIIPLDTHIARISRCLGFSGRKSQDWKMAAEITDALKRFDREDPVKYDFALCHHGISGICKGEREKNGCKGCFFRKVS